MPAPDPTPPRHTWWHRLGAVFALTLFLGGMLIFPLTSLVLRLGGGPTGLPKGHPLRALAMQIAFQRLKRLEARPTGRVLRALVEPWRPFRGAAAVFLWHYYGAATLDGTR